MKLRLEKGSIKVRLSSDEIVALNSDKHISEQIQISMNSQFYYSVDINDHQELCTVEIDNNKLQVHVPLHKATKWLSSNQVGLKEIIYFDNGESISLVVEEDLPPRKNKQRD